ncbi:P-loop containing nucleoside triphosphate hydrolases superfamily protein isoform X2 [Wolffia australiana]
MLVAKASNLRQAALSISDYALEHKKLWDEVDYYLPTDDPTCKSFQNTLRLRFLGFLYGLNKEYDDTRRRALHRKDGLPSIDDLVKELQEEESHFHVLGTLSPEAARDSTALLARHPSSAPAPTAEVAPSVLICSYCSKPGHLRKWCKKRQYDNRKKKETTDGKAMVASSSTLSTSPVTRSLMEAKLNSGISLIVDRYAYSGVAFSAAKGLPMDWCKAPEEGLIAPDVVVYLDIPPERAAERGGYGEERYERLEFQSKVSDCYRNLRDASWKIIDGCLAEEDIQSKLRGLVLECISQCKRGKPLSTLWVPK